MRSQRSREDAGETLVEVLVTIAILGIAAVAILGGVQLSVASSDIGRKQSNGTAYVRSLAESIQNSVAAGGYVTCGGSGYLTTAVKSQAGLPGSYSAAVTKTWAWNGSSWVGCTNANDKGVQRIDLVVTSPGAGARAAIEQLSVVLRKPCSGSLPSPC